MHDAMCSIEYTVCHMHFPLFPFTTRLGTRSIFLTCKYFSVNLFLSVVILSCWTSLCIIQQQEKRNWLIQDAILADETFCWLFALRWQKLNVYPMQWPYLINWGLQYLSIALVGIDNLIALLIHNYATGSRTLEVDSWWFDTLWSIWDLYIS